MGDLDEGTTEGTVSTAGTTPDAAVAATAGGQSPPAGSPPPGEHKPEWNMTQAAFNERIAQAKRSEAAAVEAKHQAWLKAKFNTTDPAEAEKRLAALAKLEQDEENRKRAAMTEQEKLKSDLEKERARATTAEARAQEFERNWQHEKQSTAIERIALGHVASEHIDYATFKFASHVRSLPKDEQAALTEKDVTKWYSDFAKKNPAFAASPEQQKKAEAKPEPKRQPVGGKPAQQPPPKPNAGSTGKVLAPGHPNSMTSAESRAHLRKQGLSY